MLGVILVSRSEWVTSYIQHLQILVLTSFAKYVFQTFEAFQLVITDRKDIQLLVSFESFDHGYLIIE